MRKYNWHLTTANNFEIICTTKILADPYKNFQPNLLEQLMPLPWVFLCATMTHTEYVFDLYHFSPYSNFITVRNDTNH